MSDSNYYSQNQTQFILIINLTVTNDLYSPILIIKTRGGLSIDNIKDDLQQRGSDMRQAEAVKEL